jgi:UDP-N-acetylmuramate--alanine ligase
MEEGMLKKCHFIGIGGIGMSGLARLILNKKIEVSGSDIVSSTVTEALSRDGAKITIGHSASNIQPDTTVVYTTDIKKDNPEYLAALELKCPMLHRSELLQILMEKYCSLAVAGTHGKTTTSSLLAWVLEGCGQSPSYAIGGIVPQLSSNSGQGTGEFFVAEACESDGTFLNYTPYAAIVTNIDLDHMDFYCSEKGLIDAFSNFMGKVVSKEHLFWCGDDSYLRKIQPEGISYGFGESCDLRASRFRQEGWKLLIDVDFEGQKYEDIEVALTGKHNALNALAVFGLALSLGLDEQAIRNALSTFGGVLRRCEKKGESHGILFIDDYAHHPTELKATLSAIRKAVGERRVVAVYQPHRYSRTKDCMGLYGDVFENADELFVTEIYAAREAPIEGVTHEVILSEVKNKLKNRCYHVMRSQLASQLATFLRPHDVVVTLGAGDITKLSHEVLNLFAVKAPIKLKLGLLFGGMSVEHEISLISSSNILKALNPDCYEVEQFGIARNGVWVLGSDAREQLESHTASDKPAKMTADIISALLQCDILFPVLHGTNGEDGTIQGFFDMLCKAYVGCDSSSSAICMDKVLSKKLVEEAGLPTLPFISFTRFEWEENQKDLIEEINQTLVYPVFVKPVHLGSSIGITKVIDKVSLMDAVKNALRYDTHVIVENGIENVREIEFAVIGNDRITVFPPGEVCADGQVHDYDSKYGLNPQKTAAAFEIQAKLSPEKIVEGMALAKAIYQSLGCSGMSRIDTFLDTNGTFWFNEINSIPGFTQYSLYPRMCAANGLPIKELVDRLIILGMQRRRLLDRLEV